MMVGCSGIGRRRAWVNPGRAALALKIRNVLVGQLDVMLALPRQQRVANLMAVYDDVRLHFGRIEDCHPGVGQCCTARVSGELAAKPAPYRLGFEIALLEVSD
jgi:hypothetical protein